MLPQGSAPAGPQKLHKQVSSTRLAVCPKRACVLVIPRRDSREGQTLILHMASPPLTLSYLVQKHGAQNVRDRSTRRGHSWGRGFARVTPSPSSITSSKDQVFAFFFLCMFLESNSHSSIYEGKRQEEQYNPDPQLLTEKILFILPLMTIVNYYQWCSLSTPGKYRYIGDHLHNDPRLVFYTHSTIYKK